MITLSSKLSANKYSLSKALKPGWYICVNVPKSVVDRYLNCIVYVPDNSMYGQVLNNGFIALAFAHGEPTPLPWGEVAGYTLEKLHSPPKINIEY